MLAQLTEDDWILRAEAMYYLAQHQAIEAIPELTRLVQNESLSSWERGRALIARVKIDSKESAKLLLSYVQHQDLELRLASAEGLEFITPPNFDLIEKLLQDENLKVKTRALSTLAFHSPQKALPHLQSFSKDLKKDQIPIFIRALVSAAQADHQQQIEKLLARCSPEESILVAEALDDLSRPQAIPVLLQLLDEFQVKDLRYAQILGILGRFDSQQLKGELQKLLEPPQDEGIRKASTILTQLVHLPELGKDLAKALKQAKNVETIRLGLIALGRHSMEPDQHKELFKNYLTHEQAVIRALAIRCLAHCESVNLFDQLKERMADSSVPVVQAALQALLSAPVSDAPRGEMVVYLEEALLSEHETTRNLAFKLLGAAGSKEDFKPAIKLLGDRLQSTDEDRRLTAAKALGSIAPDEEIEFVAKAQGYLANFRVIGTFLNDRENNGFQTVYPPEKEIDFEKKYPSKYVWSLDGRRHNNQEEIEREIGWSEVKVDQTNGKLLLALVVPPPGSLSVAYAVSDFNVVGDEEVFLSIDGDDAFKVWLNGEKILEKESTFKDRQDSIAEEKKLKLQLKPEWNRILVKSSNINHRWWVRLRLTNAEGKPIRVRSR